MPVYEAQSPKVPTPTRTALIQDAKARGVIALECEECGYRHSLERLSLGCSAAHPTIDGATCEGWDLREIMGVQA